MERPNVVPFPTNQGDLVVGSRQTLPVVVAERQEDSMSTKAEREARVHLFTGFEWALSLVYALALHVLVIEWQLYEPALASDTLLTKEIWKQVGFAAAATLLGLFAIWVWSGRDEQWWIKAGDAIFSALPALILLRGLFIGVDEVPTEIAQAGNAERYLTWWWGTITAHMTGVVVVVLAIFVIPRMRGRRKP